MAQNSMFDLNDPQTLARAVSAGIVRQATPADPRAVRRARHERIASAGQALHDSDHQALARGIVAHLGNLDGAHDRSTTAVIANHAAPSSTADQRAIAQQALTVARQTVDNETAAAKEKAAQLKPLVLAACVPLPPQGTSEQAILDRKADLLSIFAGQSTVSVNAKSQAMVRQAVKDGDTLTLYCLLGDPLKLRAASLGINQSLLQKLYVQAQLDSEGPHPLGGSAIPVGAGAYARMLPDVDAAIREASDAANQTLDDLAQQTGLR